MNSGKNMHLNFMIKSSFIDEINFWTQNDIRKQFRHRGQSNTEKIISGICESYTIKQDMLNSQLDKPSTERESPLVFCAKHQGGVSPRSLCQVFIYDQIQGVTELSSIKLYITLTDVKTLYCAMGFSEVNLRAN